MDADSCCQKCFKKLMKSEVLTICYFTIVLIIISSAVIFFLLIYLCKFEYFPYFDLQGMSFIVLTSLVAVIAWVELRGLNKNSKADMLFRIDQSLKNPETLKAMDIIRGFRLEAQKEIIAGAEEKKQAKEKINFNDIKRQYNMETIKDKIGLKIKLFLENEVYLHEHIFLINFLNSIEKICYLCNKNYISSDDVEELFVHEFIYYFDIFKPYIKDQQDLYEGNSVYGEFAALVEKFR